MSADLIEDLIDYRDVSLPDVKPGNNHFVFVAPMHNASKTLNQMLASLAGQSYSDWHLILIDDMSSQVEVSKEAEIIARWRTLIDSGWTAVGQLEGSCPPCKLQVIWNDEKKWEVANVLRGISMCKDDDVVCRIDADDWLTDLDALTYINAIYNHTKCEAAWTAHRWGYTDKNISGPMSPDIDPYRECPWVSSHLKTFRRYLLRGVPYENFTNMNGDLVKRAGDQALYLPCLYRTKRRGFIPRVMYHYTIDEQGGAVYQTEDAKFQKEEADFIRARGYVSEGIPWEQHDMFVRKA